MCFVKGSEQSSHTPKELRRQSPIKDVCVSPFNSAPGEKPAHRLNKLSWFRIIYDHIRQENYSSNLT